jgi:tRNA pseudouridine55 synthase
MTSDAKGILLIDKPRGKTSFSLVSSLRKLLGVKKIGHAGTLDPFATGVMVMLIGREYTRQSDQFLCEDKEYLAQIHLGISTDTFDCEGAIEKQSDLVPTLEQIERVLNQFQGELDQVPPMYSAKKINGKKLCELARKGKTVERQPVKVKVKITLISYEYPFVNIAVSCSKGTYIRSLAYDIGNVLGCGGHLSKLQRTRSGPFSINDCFDGSLLHSPSLDLSNLHARLIVNQ